MKKLLSSLFIVLALAGVTTLATSSSLFAVVDPSAEVGKGVIGAGGDKKDTGTALPKLIQDVVNVLLYVIGAVAVIMIVIGGIRYTTSNGDSSQITSAKNTILYAVVGLVVAMLAYAIVNFVINAF